MNIKEKQRMFSNFGNSSTGRVLKLNSDLPILIDTGSDRHIRFQDVRGIAENALLIGYDKDEDVYEISSSTNVPFNISNVTSMSKVLKIEANNIAVYGTHMSVPEIRRYNGTCFS